MLRPWAIPALVCALAPCACGSARSYVSPDPRALCGSWANSEGTIERWWLEGEDLRGEGRVFDASGELASSERLALIAGERGHAYVAQPGEAAPTTFVPIDPSQARYPIVPGEPKTGAPASVLVWAWANYEHDFPQEIHYVLIDDRLEATIHGPSPDDTGGASMGWKLERTAPCAEEGGR